MTTRNQWGIAKPHGWYDEWEEVRLARKGGTLPTMDENVQKDQTLLVDHRGSALIVRKPRSVGFRPPTP